MPETLNRTVFFISSSVTPRVDSGGGNVVIYRHLKRLIENGYKIVYINSNTARASATEFEQINLKKKLWHPPLRKFTPLLTTIRYHLIIKDICAKQTVKPTDIILSILEDQSVYLAYLLASINKTPLYLFFHDDNVFNEYFKTSVVNINHLKKVIAYCKHFFVVSKPMQQLIAKHGGKISSILYPIPKGNTAIKELDTVNFETLTLCNSGALYPLFHDGIIKNIYKATELTNNNLLIVSNVSSEFKSKYNGLNAIEIKDQFKELENLFQFFLTKIDVLLIFYSFQTSIEIRSTYSFPSKLVEFCHLGIPILIIAPPESAIGKWAIENLWMTYVPSESPIEIAKVITKLKNQSFWVESSQQVLKFAHTEFSPVQIQQKFEAALEA